METIKQLSIFARNNPGKIERVTQVLADEKISVLAFSIASQGEMGVFKLLTDDCEKAYEALKKAGLTVSLMDVLAIRLNDKPGGMHKVAEILTAKNVNVENAYIFIPGERKNGYLVIEVNNAKKAMEKLKDTKLSFLKEKSCKTVSKPKKKTVKTVKTTQKK